jgi:putative transposase
MPDHVHLVAMGRTPAAYLQGFMKLARQRSAILFKRDTAGILWQPGYFERVLRADEDVAVVAKYIQANPVRAGLAASVDEWPFTGGRLLQGPN